MILLGPTQIQLPNCPVVPVVIWGSGASINDLTDWQMDQLRACHGITFNEFYKSKIPVDYYIVREQNITPNRVAPGETLDDFYAAMNGPYIDSCRIVCRIKAEGHYHHEEHLDRLGGAGVVVNDVKGGGVANLGDDIFKIGLHHGKCSLFSAIHLAHYLGYKEIIFAGVDLYDSRYFWLKPDESRYTLEAKGKTCTDPHSTAGYVLKVVKQLGEATGIKAYTANPRSLLTRVIKVWQ